MNKKARKLIYSSESIAELQFKPFFWSKKISPNSEKRYGFTIVFLTQKVKKVIDYIVKFDPQKLQKTVGFCSKKLQILEACLIFGGGDGVLISGVGVNSTPVIF